jgi:hypothetical protein
MIGASAQVDHKPADNLPGIKFAEMEKEEIKVHTKPTTSMTAKLQQVEIKTEPRRLRFKVAKKTSATSGAQYGCFISMGFRKNSLWPKDLIQENEVRKGKRTTTNPDLSPDILTM